MRALLTEERTDNMVRREVRFSTDNGPDRSLWWEITGQALPSELKRHDVVAGSLIYRAMHEGADLHIEGPVSRDLLDRLEVFQAIWAAWRPDLYRKVRVTAAEEIETPRRDPDRMNSAVCAFSGGVDGTATTWRHYSGQAGRITRNLHAAVLIWGFDIPFRSVEGWELSCQTAAEALTDINVPFAKVKTNWRQDIAVDWDMEFAAGVTSVLRHWDEEVGTLLLGSCEEYTRLVTPWGSHPLPTHLLAGQDSTVVYDGGELTRTDKVRLISEWPAAYDRLRVCYRHSTGKNCGVCEKCVRTKLNAIASDVPIPKSLGEPPTVERILKLGNFNGAQRELLGEIVDVAKRRGVDNPLIRATEKTLRMDRLKAPLRPYRDKLMKALGR